MDPNSPEAMARALMGEPQEDPYGSMFGSAPQGNVAQSVLDVGGKVGPAFAHGGLYGVAKQAGYDPPGKAIADVLQSPEANTALGTLTDFPSGYGFSGSIEDALRKWNNLGERWKPPLKWGDPGFPWPKGEAGQRAQQAGFTTPVWHGRSMPGEAETDPLLNNRSLHDFSQFYTAHNPKLSDMYSIWRTQHPDKWDPESFFRGAPNNPQLMPLLLRDKRFPVVNAGGKSYDYVNRDAIMHAEDLNAPGVTIRNVGDEPAGGYSELGNPQTISILLGSKGGRNARSPFAKFQDLNANDLLAGLGGAAAIPALANKDQGSQ